MKRKFRITIEGESYEVEIEEMEEMEETEKTETGQSNSPTQKPPSSAEAPRFPPKASPAIRPPTVRAGEAVVASPMPGTIVSINVKVGDSVKAGDILLVLESMKIQNEIPSPKDGVIKEVLVPEGKYVKRREPLIIIGG